MIMMELSLKHYLLIVIDALFQIYNMMLLI